MEVKLLRKLLNLQRSVFPKKTNKQTISLLVNKLKCDVTYLEVSVWCGCLRELEAVSLLSLVLCRHRCVLWTRESLRGERREYLWPPNACDDATCSAFGPNKQLPAFSLPQIRDSGLPETCQELETAGPGSPFLLSIQGH